VPPPPPILAAPGRPPPPPPPRPAWGWGGGFPCYRGTAPGHGGADANAPATCLLPPDSRAASNPSCPASRWVHAALTSRGAWRGAAAQHARLPTARARPGEATGLTAASGQPWGAPGDPFWCGPQSGGPPPPRSDHRPPGWCGALSLGPTHPPACCWAHSAGGPGSGQLPGPPSGARARLRDQLAPRTAPAKP